MKLIKNNKYFLGLVAFLVMLLCVNDVSAKRITCEYDISDADIPYRNLTVVYSNDGSEIETESKEHESAKYVAYYQFDDGTKYYLNENVSSKEGTNLWNADGDSNNYLNFISITVWIKEGCLEDLELYYNDKKTSFGFSSTSFTTLKPYNFDYMKSLVFPKLAYNSEEGMLYTVIISANESRYFKVYQVYSGELISRPLPAETGLPEIQDGKQLCWQTKEADCWNFNSPVTSNLTLNAVYLSNSGNTGFIGDIDKKYVSCSGVDIPYGIPYIVHNIINIIQIVTPIILIILGMLDFVKAVIASDEKRMKEASSKFIRRAIAAVIIFFVIAIVKFVFGQVLSDSKGALGCIDCFLNDNCTTHELIDK